MRLSNIRSKKLTSQEEIQNRTHKLKENIDSLKVEQGDVMKFGRVRFRIKKLHVGVGFKADSSAKAPLRIDSMRESTLHEMSIAQETQQYSRRSTDGGGMEYMVRMHSSANYSFDMQKQNLTVEEVDDRDGKQPSIHKELNCTENRTCRICLSEEDFPDHELITPCNCMGSMRFIGLSCLKNWLEGKRHCKETPVVNSYIWKNLECEICKQPFKDIFVGQDGRELNLLNY